MIKKLFYTLVFIFSNLVTIFANFKIILSIIFLRYEILIFLNHNDKGGAEKFFQNIVNKYIDKKRIILNVYPLNLIFIDFFLPIENKLFFRIKSKNLFLYLKIIKKLFPLKININHIHGFNLQTIEKIGNYFNIMNIYIHDYIWICPRIFLSKSDIFCNLPNNKSCNICLSDHINYKDINSYRSTLDFIVNSNIHNVIFPTEYTKKSYEKIIQGKNFKVEYNEKVNFSEKRFSRNKNKILILGVLTEHKGRSLVIEFLKWSSNFDIEIKHMGYSIPEIFDYSNYKCTGEYSDSLADNILNSEDPNLIWFPVRIPETFSYTLSIAIRNNYKIIAPNIGSFPERLINYHSYSLFNYNDSSNNIFKLLQKNLEN